MKMSQTEQPGSVVNMMKVHAFGSEYDEGTCIW